MIPVRCFVPLLQTLFAFAYLPALAPCLAAPLTVLHTFGASGSIRPKQGDQANLDGARPLFPLTQGRDGALYGTTIDGGTHGTGVVFKVNPDGTDFSVLHSFEAFKFGLFERGDNKGGSLPGGSLVQAGDGTLYGATERGGSAGTGAIFKLNPDGTGFQVLHHFGSQREGDGNRNGDGIEPAGLTLAANGMLYGSAIFAGAKGGGVIFRMRQDGSAFQILHAFRGVVYDKGTNDDGAYPQATPVFGRDGALYGTTSIGGKYGCGVIYRMTPDGEQFVVLHNFQLLNPEAEVGNDFSEGPLTPSAEGFLYGTTRQGGANGGGTLFKIGQDGTGFIVLHTFPGSSDDGGDGRLPAATPILGRDGRLYGLTGAGGANGVGTAFWTSTDGTKFAVIHDFGPSDAAWHNTDGAYPRAGLLQGRDGALYGVAAGGGPYGTGTVFRLVPPQSR